MNGCMGLWWRKLVGNVFSGIVLWERKCVPFECIVVLMEPHVSYRSSDVLMHAQSVCVCVCLCVCFSLSPPF